MATEPELRRAVLESPDDDAPRHAYAGWCDSRASPPPDPRGEFIRLQLDIKKIEAEGKYQAPVRLHRISSELSAPHSKSWAGVVATVTPRYGFVAGFVEQVTLTADEFLKHGGAMLAAEPVRHLDISSLGTRAQDFFSTPLLGGIRSLVLDRCAAGNNGAALLAASPYVNQIRWLSLAFNGIDLVGVRSLARSTSLKSLKYANFFGNPCDPAEVHSADQGVILRSTLPPDGKLLESEFGPIPWLHRDAETLADSTPNRYFC